MWLLEEHKLHELRAAIKSVAPSVTASQRASFAELSANGSIAAAATPRSLRVAGDVAEIRIEGVLTQRPDFWLWLLGYANTTYQDVQQALALAENDPSIKRISLWVDSPGGQVDGMFDCVAAIESVKKPKSTRSPYACSAAFGLAAVGGAIEATSAAATFGSVGVVASYLVDDELVEITSTEAPNKRPDPTTPEGQAVIREYLDAVHQLFAEGIARGRGTTVADVNAEYGRGSVMLAGDAKKRKMIDSIAKPSLRSVRANEPDASAEGGGQETTDMDIKTLKAQHPQLAEELLAEGRTQGSNSEHERVVAHLTMGKQSGPKGMEIALAAIESKEGFTLVTSAKYMAVAMNLRDTSVRQQESDGAGAVADGAVAPAASGAQDVGDQAAAIMAAKRGGVVVAHG
jgi:ClpP class serine protease